MQFSSCSSVLTCVHVVIRLDPSEVLHFTCMLYFTVTGFIFWKNQIFTYMYRKVQTSRVTRGSMLNIECEVTFVPLYFVCVKSKDLQYHCVFVTLYTVFCTGFVGMYVIYLRTKFKRANLSGYVFTAVQLKAKYRYLGGASVLFFYILSPVYPHHYHHQKTAQLYQ